MRLPSSLVYILSGLPFPPREQLLVVVVGAVLVVAVAPVISPPSLSHSFVAGWCRSHPRPVPVALRRWLLGRSPSLGVSGGFIIHRCRRPLPVPRSRHCRVGGCWVVPLPFLHRCCASLLSSLLPVSTPQAVAHGGSQVCCGGGGAVPSPSPASPIVFVPVAPHSTPRAVAHGSSWGSGGDGASSSFFWCCSPHPWLVPPREQSLAAAVGDAGVVVPHRPRGPFVIVVPLLHGPFPPHEQVLTAAVGAAVVVVAVVILPLPSFPILPCRPSPFSFSFPGSRFPFSVSHFLSSIVLAVVVGCLGLAWGPL
jgi:hypothetical protein